MVRLDPLSLPVSELHAFLLGGIAPRPIAFVSTVNESGQPNLSPFSFFNVFSANPPIAVFSPARRGRDGSTKHSLENARKVPELTINVVNYSMVQQVSLASADYPEGVNEFRKAGFTELPSETVRPPRVGESPFQMECRVREIIELGQGGGAGNLVVCEVLLIHISPEILDERGRIDPFKTDHVGRCGGDWYCRVNPESLFQVAKPLKNIGVGVDSLPPEVRNSKILTGNDLGKLGNVEEIPDETSVNEYKLLELSDIFIAHESDPHGLEIALHREASKLLAENRVEEAWKTLLAFNN
jgi:flavin reductase (DIM6/NTAB) family NADH-FMN oxidoreductase RutF